MLFPVFFPPPLFFSFEMKIYKKVGRMVQNHVLHVHSPVVNMTLFYLVHFFLSSLRVGCSHVFTSKDYSICFLRIRTFSSISYNFRNQKI